MRALSLLLLLGVIAAVAVWLAGDGGEREGLPLVHTAPRIRVSPDAPPAPATAAGEAEPLEASPRTSDATPPAATPDATTPPTGTAPDGLLRVTVRQRADGAPVADVVVRVTLDGDVEVEARTDDAGRADVTFAERVQLRGVVVLPGPRTTRGDAWVGRPLRPGTVHDVLVELPAPATLSGVVLGPDDAPVGGAEVLGWCRRDPSFAEADGDDPPARTAVADARGRFTLEAVGPEFAFSARAPGMVCRWRARGEVPPGAVVDGLVLGLEPARELAGRLLTDDGRPVPGAEVVARSGGTLWSSDGTYDTGIDGVSRADPVPVRTVSDDDGRFVLAPVASTAYDVRVDHAPWLPFATEHRADDGPLEIRLARGVGLSGTVRDTTGAPVPDARVRLRVSPTDFVATGGGVSRTTTTDADGRFTLDGLLAAGRAEEPSGGLGSALRSLFGGGDAPTAAPPETALSVSAAGHAIEVVQPVEIPADGRGHVDVVLGPASPLAGRVLDERDVPVPDVPVRIFGDRLVEYANVRFGRPTTWEWVLGIDSTFTDADGRFRFDGLYDGAFEVRARDLETDLEQVVTTRSGREDVVVRLDRASMRRVVLTGAVRDAWTGAPVEDFTVTPMVKTPDGFGGSVHEVHDAAGRFELAGLEPATMQLVVSAAGYAPWEAPLADYDVGEHVFDVALAPARSLTVRVVDERGAPVPLAGLRFRDDRGEVVQVVHGGGRSDHAMTGPDGEAELRGLPAGRVTVLVLTRDALAGVDPPVERTFDLTVAREAVHEIVVPDAREPRRLTWFVLGSESAHPDQALDDSPAGAAVIRQATADGARWFVDAPVEVRVLHDGQEVAHASCRPTADGDYETAGAVGRRSSVGRTPAPILHVEAWQDVPLTVELTAPGHATRTLTVEPGTADVSVLVTLVRAR